MANDALRKVVAAGGKAPKKAPKTPLWRGPTEDGITFSLLSAYLVCKERYRLKVIEGLAAAEDFNHRIEYGNMWHVCEESLARRGPGHWEAPLLEYCKGLVKKYRMASEQIEKWYQVCVHQFPVYVDYWADHPDMLSTNRLPLAEEVSYKIPFTLPSGRIVYLRGKFDSVDKVTDPNDNRQYVWLQENKTKGDIKEVVMQRQLKFDLQTMFYLTALQQLNLFRGFGDAATDALAEAMNQLPIAGVRYNVIRRPLSGGKGNIVQHKPSKSNPDGETATAFYDRLQVYFRDDPAFFFMRWMVPVDEAQIEAFQKRCMIPLLENVCDDYEWWETCYRKSGDVFNAKERNRVFSDHCPRHFVYPYGVWNILAEGGTTEVDEYMFTGSEVGLDRVTTLFPELAP